MVGCFLGMQPCSQEVALWGKRVIQKLRIIVRSPTINRRHARPPAMKEAHQPQSARSPAEVVVGPAVVLGFRALMSERQLGGSGGLWETGSRA